MNLFNVYDKFEWYDQIGRFDEKRSFTMNWNERKEFFVTFLLFFSSFWSVDNESI